MKIKITKEAKRWLTVAQMPEVKELINELKEISDTDFVSEILSAGRIASGWNCEESGIRKSSAEIAGNRRVWNFYGESEDLDVWIEAEVFIWLEGFYKIGFYLSDIWQAGTEESNAEIKSHMYIEEYRYVRK